MMKKCMIWALASVLCEPHVFAHEFKLTYTTEMQTDFKNRVNWINLLRSDFRQSLGASFQLEAASISIAETYSDPLVDDLQIFSNIEEKNLPFALAIFGVNYRSGRSTFFAGVRNVNEDYFTSPCTSFFTNSSCGIFPTLSATYPLANYPSAAMCIDYKYEAENWSAELSLYNGTGHNAFTVRGNTFRVCPTSDGVLGLATFNYRKEENGYYVGFGIHSGLSADHEMGAEAPYTPGEKEKVTYVCWTYAEQYVAPGVCVLLQYSVNPLAQSGCRAYAGAGGTVRCGKQTIGIFADYADFVTEHEWATELTCRLPCGKTGELQPALHFIHNSRGFFTAGLLRFSF